MTVVSITTAEIAKTRLSELSAIREGQHQKNWANSLVMRAVQAIWPTKTDMALVCATKRSDRLCRYWLENKYSLGADDLVLLLRTDGGLQILEAIMGGAKPVWWRDFKRSVKRAEVRRRQKQLELEIQQLEQGELDI